MEFRDAVQHRTLVVEIATTAKTQSRTPLLGVLYDEFARCVFRLDLHCCGTQYFFLSFPFRKEWEDMSLKLGSGFKVADEAGKMSEETLRKAKNLHDILFKSNAPQGQSSRTVFKFCMVGSNTPTWFVFFFQASGSHEKRKRENDNQFDTKNGSWKVGGS